MNEVAEFNPKSDLPESFEYVDLESVVGTEMVSHRTGKTCIGSISWRNADRRWSKY